jgi:hypothetical protein
VTTAGARRARAIPFVLGAVAITGCAHLRNEGAEVALPSPAVRPVNPAPPALRPASYARSAQLPIPSGALVCAGGDVMLGSNLDTAWARQAKRVAPFDGFLPDPDSLLAPLRPMVADADVVLVNVEGAIGEGQAPHKCRPGATRCYAFRQEATVAGALRRFLPGGEVVGNVANNHAGDAGPLGLEQTVTRLEGAGISVTGADTLPTLVPLPSGDTLAVLGFSTFSVGLDARDLAAVQRRVSSAAARFHRVIVSVHLGAEGIDAQRTRDREERFVGEDRGNPVAFARAAVEAGASVVFGHGPHVLRAIEWQGNALVVYSLGNLLTFGPFSLVEPLDRGGFVCALLDDRGRVFSAELRPTMQTPPGRAVPDPAGRAWTVVDSLSALDFPATGVRVVDGQLLRRQPTP